MLLTRDDEENKVKEADRNRKSAITDKDNVAVKMDSTLRLSRKTAKPSMMILMFKILTRMKKMKTRRS